MRRWVVPAGLALAVLAIPAPAAGQPEATHVDVQVGYRCELASGPVRVDLRVTAELPPSVAVNEPLTPSSVALSLSVPPPGLPSAASVTATARLDTAITQRDTANATWSGALSEPVPVTDPLVLDIPVDAPPPVVFAAPGDAVLTTAALTVTFTGYQADGNVTDPPSTTLTCAPAPGEQARLAVVGVAGATGQPPGEERPPPGAVVVGPEQRREQPDVGAMGPELVPVDCAPIDPPTVPNTTPSSVKYCAFMTGFAGVAKLDSSVVQPHALVNVAQTNVQLRCKGLMIHCQFANILPNIGGEPKMSAMDGAFHAFGFVPIEAKMELTAIGLTFADITLDTRPGNPDSLAIITGDYSVRVYDATVNGVPLDLGPNCRTERPLDIRLLGRPPYTLTEGGVLNAVVEIPAFDGCGVTEDLDLLMSELVSGPDNPVRLTQGNLCPLATGPPRFCPPSKPDPQ